eukprot:s257_g25.t1
MSFATDFLFLFNFASKVVALICQKEDHRELYVANCGDSRAVMVSGAGAVAMPEPSEVTCQLYHLRPKLRFSQWLKNIPWNSKNIWIHLEWEE